MGGMQSAFTVLTVAISKATLRIISNRLVSSPEREGLSVFAPCVSFFSTYLRATQDGLDLYMDPTLLPFLVPLSLDRGTGSEEGSSMVSMGGWRRGTFSCFSFMGTYDSHLE